MDGQDMQDGMYARALDQHCGDSDGNRSVRKMRSLRAQGRWPLILSILPIHVGFSEARLCRRRASSWSSTFECRCELGDLPAFFVGGLDEGLGCGRVDAGHGGVVPVEAGL